MKKYILVGMMLVTLSACMSNKVVVNRQIEHPKYGQMLLGEQTREQFSISPFNEWYDKEYAEYEPDEESITALKKKKLGAYHIIAFVGTWCSDSHRELPRMMKILDAIKYPQNKLSIIGLNRKMESPSGEEGVYNIRKVPTFIVKRYGVEVGRIVEFPNSGFLEKDLLEIISRKGNSEILEREVNPKQ